MASRLKLWTYHILHFILIALYGISLYVKFLVPNQSFLNHYLADLICMPIIFYLVGEIFRILKINSILSLPKIIFGVVYFSFIFEFLLPQFSNRYTRDWYDVLMYCIGGLFYYVVFKLVNLASLYISSNGK
tara:strand:- start:416 stop:808 length:393 start_codon:yes stop_codon:yes gene_type:complete